MRYPRGHKPANSGLAELCVECGGELVYVVTGHWLVPGDRDPEISYFRHKARPREPMTDRDRRFCSKCGKPGEWYTFKPGSGECKECQP